MASNWNQREKHLNLDGNVNSPTKILENSVCVSIKLKEREINNTWKRLKKGESFLMELTIQTYYKDTKYLVLFLTDKR